MNNINAIVLTLDEGDVQTKYKEIPINVKSSVQTGPKIQFGGLKLGLLIFLYQSPSLAVHNAPRAPTRLHTIINPIKRIQLISILFNKT